MPHLNKDMDVSGEFQCSFGHDRQSVEEPTLDMDCSEESALVMDCSEENGEPSVQSQIDSDKEASPQKQKCGQDGREGENLVCSEESEEPSVQSQIDPNKEASPQKQNSGQDRMEDYLETEKEEDDNVSEDVVENAHESVGEYHAVPQQLLNASTENVETEKEEEDNVSNTVAENTDKNVCDYQALPQQMSNASTTHTVSISQCQSTVRQEFEDHRGELSSSTLCVSEVWSGSEANIMNGSSQALFSEDGNTNNSDADEINFCNPIILNVRGNATDMDCTTELSTMTDSSTIHTTTDSVSSIPNRNSENIEPQDFLLENTNNENIREGCMIPETNNNDETATAANVASTVSTTIQSTTGSGISSVGQDHMFQGSANVTMPASSLLMSVMSNIPAVSAQIPTQLNTAKGSTLKTTATKISLLNSTPISVPARGIMSVSVASNLVTNPHVISNTNASASDTIGNLKRKIIFRKPILTRTSNTPVAVSNTNAQIVRIVNGSESSYVVKQGPVVSTGQLPKTTVVTTVSDGNSVITNNTKNNNDTVSSGVNEQPFQTENLVKTIVSKIFLNHDKKLAEGMTRYEVFNTTLLDPCKKPRENPKKQWVCGSCGDEFYSEEFLIKHLGRKVFILDYYCFQCKRKLKFFNKCRFWMHARREVKGEFNENIIRYGSSFFRLKPGYDLDDDKEGSSVFTCKFCCAAHTYDKPWIESHFQRSSSFLYTCSKCTMLLPNRCALLAHQAIHEADGKNCYCPECGELIDQSYRPRVLFQHLDSCFHFNTGYVMPCECGQLFASTDLLTHHFLKSHVKVLYRCNFCGSCFTSFDFLSVHCATTHKSTLSPVKIVLCALCNQGFQNPSKLKLHVEYHVGKIAGVRRKALICFLCQKHFNSPTSLNSHIEKDHAHRPKRCTICFGLFGSRQKLVEHIVSKTCSTKKVPNKLHVCMDAPSVQDSVDLNFHKLFKVTITETQTTVTASSTSSSTAAASIAVNPAVSFVKAPLSNASSPPVSNTTVSSSKLIAVLSKVTTATFSAPNVAPLRALLPKVISATASIPKVTSATVSNPKVTSATASNPKDTSATTSVSKVTPATTTSFGRIQAPIKARSTLTVKINKTHTAALIKRKPAENVCNGTNNLKFQCHSCKICFIGSIAYGRHMNLHKSSVIKTDCGICKKYVGASLIQSHMEDHQKNGEFVCSLCHKNFITLHDALRHSKNMCFYKLVHDDGESFIKDSDENMDSCNVNIEECDNASNNMQSSSMEISQEKASVFPCLMCGLAFSNKQKKEDHVSRFHDGTRTLYFCLVCKRKGIRKCFTKNNLLSKHISRKHRIVNPAAIANAIHKEEQNVASGEVVPAEVSDLSNGDDAPPPKRLRLDNKGEFMCGKCGFSNEDSKLFEDHIATHNPRKEPQCPECGLCFTVLVALKKHLFVVHKIKAMDEYLEKKGMLESEIEAPEDDDDEDDVGNFSGSVLRQRNPKSERKPSNIKGTRSTGKAVFECTVCYRKLSSEVVLKKHMRNHGMAFIRSSSKRHNPT